MSNTSMAFAMYKPIPGKEKELKAVVVKHIPALQGMGLITSRSPYLAQAADGTFIEVFEWKDDEAKRLAHSKEEIRAIWTDMEDLCTFPSMADLEEASKGPFPNFEMLE